jgi:hypothetical protein
MSEVRNQRPEASSQFVPHKLICQCFINRQTGRTFEKKRNPWESGQRVNFPRVSQRRVKNGDINGMFHIL